MKHSKTIPLLVFWLLAGCGVPALVDKRSSGDRAASDAAFDLGLGGVDGIVPLAVGAATYSRVLVYNVEKNAMAAMRAAPIDAQGYKTVRPPVLADFFAYGPYDVGVEVAILKDSRHGDEPIIITTPSADRAVAPVHMKAFRLNGQMMAETFVYDLAFRGGASIATGNLFGDGIDRVVVVAGPGGGPHVKIFRLDAYNGGYAFVLEAQTFAFDVTYTGGTRIAVGDLTGDGKDDLMFSPMTGELHVKVMQVTRVGATVSFSTATDWVRSNASAAVGYVGGFDGYNIGSRVGYYPPGLNSTASTSNPNLSAQITLGLTSKTQTGYAGFMWNGKATFTVSAAGRASLAEFQWPGMNLYASPDATAGINGSPTNCIDGGGVPYVFYCNGYQTQTLRNKNALAIGNKWGYALNGTPGGVMEIVYAQATRRTNLIPFVFQYGQHVLAPNDGAWELQQSGVGRWTPFAAYEGPFSVATHSGFKN